MDQPVHTDGARLLADIGGTNARFAIERGPGRIEDSATLRCADYATVVDAVRAYLARPELAGAGVRHAAIAIANPVEGDFIKMTNHVWEFSISAAQSALGLDTLLVVNDFSALSMAVPSLAPSELVQIGGKPVAGTPKSGAASGVLGAGTGLGVGGLVGVHGEWHVLPSEGGHVAFSPCDEREQALLAWCWNRWPHVSAERFLSGPGLALIHEGLAATRGLAVDALTPAQVVERGLDGSDALCLETLEVFSGALGTMAANLAVTLCARGGIYIGGGVVPRLGEWFARSPFRARFDKKGRFSSFTADIPCYVIHAPYPALAGAAALLARHLQEQS
jgi:glucokinase